MPSTTLLFASEIEYMTYMSRPSGLMSIGPLKVLTPWSTIDAGSPARPAPLPGNATWSALVIGCAASAVGHVMPPSGLSA